MKRDCCKSLIYKSLFLITVLLVAGCGQSEFDKAQEAFIEGDYEQTLLYIEPLSKSGNADAQQLLAQMYEQGLGVEQDTRLASTLFLQAAEGGNAAAQVKIASMYLQGKGLKKDYWEAMKWSRKAALKGNPEAEANLAYMFHDGIGVSQDYVEAAKWYRKAALKGLASAQHDLGVMYHQARGIEQDYQQAMRWYQLAANQGFEKSQDILASLYESGVGLPESVDKLQWLQNQTQAKDVTAQYFLATLYYEGKLVPADIIQAYAWAGIAAAGGMIKAQPLRIKLESRLNPSNLRAARQLSRSYWQKYGNKTEAEEQAGRIH